MEEFKEQVGKELLEGLENPLPNSFRIKADNPQDVPEIAQRLKRLRK